MFATKTRKSDHYKNRTNESALKPPSVTHLTTLRGRHTHPPQYLPSFLTQDETSRYEVWRQNVADALAWNEKVDQSYQMDVKGPYLDLTDEEFAAQKLMR